jgi:hypothetical protein
MNEPDTHPTIEIVLGAHAPGQGPKWSGHIGSLLYADKKNRLLWVWLPEPMSMDDNCAGARGNGSDPILLGDLDDGNKAGRLALLQLEPTQVSELERAITSVGSLAEELASPLPSTIDPGQSLGAYILGRSPDLGTVRRIASFISSQIATIPADGLSHILSRRTFEDLSDAQLTSAHGSVRRDPHLARELRNVVEARRVVFISGGTKSGLSEFLEQFKEQLAAEAPVGAHLSADFNPATFDEMAAILELNAGFSGILGRRGGDAEVASLLMSLAYDAYTNVKASTGVDLSKLSSFIPSRAATFLEEFAFSYLRDFVAYSDLTDGSGRSESQIEPFLSFLGKLMASAGKGGTLTVILSFPGLTNWLNDTHGHVMAERLNRSLWRELGTFAATNYDPSTGKILPGSLLSKLADNVGIVIETKRLAMPAVTEGFCKYSVLTIPPLSRTELTSLWQQRFRTIPTEEILEGVERATGGAPWFVDLLLDCFQIADAGGKKRPAESLDGAIKLATAVVNGEALPPSREIDTLKEKWVLYTNDLKGRLSRGALTNPKALLDLVQAAGKIVKISPSVQAAEWLESGLIWLKPRQGTHSLRALQTYPYVATFPAPTLVNLCITALTAMEIAG